MAEVNGINRIGPLPPTSPDTPKPSPRDPKDPRAKIKREEVPTKEDDPSDQDHINEYV